MAPSAPPGEMQEPTCSGTFIRTVQDVHRIFYAVLLGKLPIVTRRLDAQERDALNAGCCYVWEERGPQSVTGLGIERFTEGRRWSASRVRDDFLFYYEKFKGATEDQRPPRDWDPLVKQTYSVFVNPSPGQPEPVPPKKWHLTAYYTDNAIDSLHTVDDLPATKDLRVPDGVFRCSRSIKPRSRARPASRTPRIAPSKATTKTATLASSLPASSSPTAAGPSRPPKRKRSVPARTRSSKKVKEEPAPSPTPAPPSPAPSASVSPAASPESALTDLPSRSSSVESQDHVKHELKIQTDIIALEERGVSISPMHGTSGKQSASRSPMSARPSPQETRANRKTDGFSSSRSPQTARAPVQGSGLSVFAPFPSDASPPPSSKTYTQLHTDTQSQLQPRAHAQAPHGAPLAAAAAATAARPDSPLHAHDIGSNLYPRSSQAQAHAPQFSSMQLSVSPIHPSSIQPQLTHVQNQFTTVPPAQISFQESLPAHDGFPTVNSPLASAVYSASQASPVHDQPLPVGAGFAGEARRDRTSEHVVSSYSGYPMGNTGMHRIAPAASSFAPLEPPMAPPPTSTGQGTPTPSGLHDYSHSYGPGYHTAFQSTPSSTAGNVDAFRNYASSSNSLAMAFPRSSNAPPITSAVTASTPSSARSPGLSAAHPPAGSWSGGGGATQHFGGATPGTLPFAGSQAGIQGYEANHDSGYSAVQTQEQMGAEFVDAQMQDYGRGQTQGYSVIQQTYAQPEYAYTHQFPSPTFGGSAADFNNISDGGHLHPSDAPDGQEPVLRGSASGVIKQQQQGSAFIDTQHKYVTSQALPNSFDDFRSQGSSFSSRTNVSLELDTMSSSTSSWYPGPSQNHFDPPSPAVPQYGLSPQTPFSRAGTAYSTASTPARSQALRGRSQSLADAFAFMPEPSPAPSMLSNSSGSSGSSGGHGSGRVGGWAGERRALVNPQHLRRVNPAKPREPSDSQALQMFGRVA